MRHRTISILLAVIAALTYGSIAEAVKAQCVTAPSGMTDWWPADGNAFDII